MRIDATTGLRSKRAEPAAKPASPLEVWFVAGALLSTMLVSLLRKYISVDSPDVGPLVEAVWLLLYIVATVRLLTMRALAGALLARSLVLVGFLALLFISTLWSVQPDITFKNAIELIGTTTIGYYIVVRFTLIELLDILAVTFGVAAVLSIAVIFGAPGHGRTDWGAGAWAGIFQEKNDLGAAMSLAGLSLIALFFQRTGKRRIPIVLLLVLTVALLAGSASATAIADFGVVTILLLAGYACRSTKFGVAARVVFCSVAVLIAVAYLIVGITPDTIIVWLGREPNLTGRTDFWPYLQQAIADRPILGYGYDGFFGSDVGNDYLSYLVVEMGGWSPYHAHNSFMQILLDGGLAGMGLFAFALLGAFRRAFTYAWNEANRAALWPVAILLYLFCGSFTETYFARFNTVEWVLCVAAMLYPLRAKSREA